MYVNDFVELVLFYFRLRKGGRECKHLVRKIVKKNVGYRSESALAWPAKTGERIDRDDGCSDARRTGDETAVKRGWRDTGGRTRGRPSDGPMRVIGREACDSANGIVGARNGEKTCGVKKENSRFENFARFRRIAAVLPTFSVHVEIIKF